MSNKKAAGELTYHQDNELINAAYAMTIDERRLLMLAMSKIGDPRLRSPDPSEPLTFELTATEWVSHFGHPSKAYQSMKAACKRLKRRDVVFKNKTYTEDVMWCDSIRYIEDEGKVRLRFGWTLSHYLLGMYQEFTTTNLMELRHLSSVHSVRIYEMCAQFRKTGLKITTIEDLKRALCLEGKYKLVKDFRVKVIEPAVKEINKNTDLNIKATFLKKGRAFDRIEFRIKTKKRKEEQPYLEGLEFSSPKKRKSIDITDTDW